MNIFVLDYTPAVAAEAHCDKHVVKMVLETAQLLCTCHRICGSEFADELYKPTHVNHPCSKWLRESTENYHWTSDLFFWLLQEYYYRFDKEHACARLLPLIEKPPEELDIADATDFALAMPDEYKEYGDPVECYRQYYAWEKSRLLYYTGRTPPDWLSSLTQVSYRESSLEDFEILPDEQDSSESEPDAPSDQNAWPSKDDWQSKDDASESSENFFFQ